MVILVSMAFYCYILECSNGSYYTGWSKDPIRRLKQHNAGRGAAYTRMHLPVKLVYFEEQPDQLSAMKREIQIKRWTHQRKQDLIASKSLDSEISTPGTT